MSKLKSSNLSFYALLGFMAALSFTTTLSAAVTDYSFELDRIHYNDANGLNIDYGFSTTPQNPAPATHIIPSNAVTAPTPWNEATFLWESGFSPSLTSELTGDSYLMSTQGSYGFASIGVQGASSTPSAPENWLFETRLTNFNNTDEQNTQYGFCIGSGSSDSDHVGVRVGGGWFSGEHEGITYENMLCLWLSASVYENGEEVLYWSSSGDGPGLVINGLNPTNAQIDLRISVTGGYNITGEYRINSDDNLDWAEVSSYQLSDSFAPASGLTDQFPYVSMSIENIPEPATLSMLTFGGLVFFRRRR